MNARITVVGSLNMDLVIRSPRIPQPGETIIGHDLHTVPGGKGANQAVAAARLGARVGMVGRVGDDDFGRPLLLNLAANCVDAQHVIKQSGVASGVAMIIVDDAGENCIVVASGANAELSPADVDAAEEAIATADLLLLQLESPLETVAHAASVARAHGTPVVLNPAPVPADALSADLLEMVDVLIPNQGEALALAGISQSDSADFGAVASAVRELGPDIVVLTLGSQGALVLGLQGSQTVPAFPVQVVDTTAAGDAFVAGLAVAMAEGKPVFEAARWGNAAGALAATRFGAQPSLPERQDLLGLLDGTSALVD
ncbi:MAG: ribokinase [Chloroflexota bacterium]|nr:ribokinase [Chloroflexota bacterium]